LPSILIGAAMMAYGEDYPKEIKNLFTLGGFYSALFQWPLMTLGQAKLATKVVSIKRAEKPAMLFLERLIEEELELYMELIDNKMPERPTVFDVNKFYIGGSELFLGDKLKAGIYDYEVPIEGESPRSYGNIIHCSPDGIRNPLQNMPFRDVQNRNGGGFYLEKYIRIIDKEELSFDNYAFPLSSDFGPEFTGDTSTTLDTLRVAIENRSEHLKNIVNIQEFKSFLNTMTQGIVDQTVNISDVFGNASLSEDGSSYIGSIGIKFGVRVCMFGPATVNETNLDKYDEAAVKFKSYHLNKAASEQGPFIEYSDFPVPIVSYEQDIPDLKLFDLIDTDDNLNEDLKCYVDKLVELPQFKFFFDSIINVKKSTSILMSYSDHHFLQSCGYSKGGLPHDTIAGQQSISERKSFEDAGEDDFLPPFQSMEDIIFNDTKSEARKFFVSNYKRNDFDPPDEGDSIFDSLRDEMQARIQNLWGSIGFTGELPWWLRNRIRKDKTTDKDGLPCKNQYAGLFNIKKGEK
jgi:hypothetical protein